MIVRKLTEGKQTEMPVGLSLNEVAIDDINFYLSYLNLLYPLAKNYDDHFYLQYIT